MHHLNHASTLLAMPHDEREQFATQLAGAQKHQGVVWVESVHHMSAILHLSGFGEHAQEGRSVHLGLEKASPNFVVLVRRELAPDNDSAEWPGASDLLYAFQDGVQRFVGFREQVVDARRVVTICDCIAVSATDVPVAVQPVDLLQDAYLDALDARHVLVCLRVNNDVGDVEVDHRRSGSAVDRA